MEQVTSLADRFESARERIDEEVERVQKEIQARRKRFEKQLNTGRKNIEKQTRKQVKQLRQISLVKELEKLRDEANRRIEEAVESVLGALQIASKGDVDRIDRKLSKINKRLKDMERTRKTNGQSATSPVAQA
jgi:hypothetical protein